LADRPITCRRSSHRDMTNRPSSPFTIDNAVQRRTMLWLMVVVACLSACSTSSQPTDNGVQRVVIAGQTFELELAINGADRYQGLSDRASLPPGGGMLFVFPDVEPQTFVMRRCLMPIDLIFLGADGRIVQMHAMKMEPYDRDESALKRYRSVWPAQFAIELEGGQLAQLGLKNGDPVDLPVETLKAMAR